MTRINRRSVCITLFIAGLVTGCGSPSAVNITLRKENQALRDKLATFEREQAADRATIASLQRDSGVTPGVSDDLVQKLFTTHGLLLGRLTGVSGTTLKVYVVPADEANQPLKAAGTFTVEAFDLKRDNARIGSWSFDPATARQNWFGQALLYTYVLTCPLDTTPTGEITLKVTFVDALTQRSFTVQGQINPTASSETLSTR